MTMDIDPGIIKRSPANCRPLEPRFRWLSGVNAELLLKIALFVLEDGRNNGGSCEYSWVVLGKSSEFYRSPTFQGMCESDADSVLDKNREVLYVQASLNYTV